MKFGKKEMLIMALVMVLTTVQADGYASQKKNKPHTTPFTKQTSVFNCNQTEVCNVPRVTLHNPVPNMDKQTKVCIVATKENGLFLDDTASSVILQVNEERKKYGLSPLKVSPQLSAAARIRADEIVKKFSHTRPDGSSWSSVSSAALGENIARGHSSVDRVMAAWMTSEGHRKNILRERFGSIGVCVVKVNGIYYWVQLFGR